MATMRYMALFSELPRCDSCERRKILPQAGAKDLERLTGGRLVAFECPTGHGWHVRLR